MELVRDPRVRCLIATHGGTCSASMIPHLDFDEIRRNPKVICGFSDVTSLHLAILAYSGLSTFYGPAVIRSFGEWPSAPAETRDGFLNAVQNHVSGARELTCPGRFSAGRGIWESGRWRETARLFEPNQGWKALSPGRVTAPIIVANLNTLLHAAGTGYFPELAGKILIIEEMDAPLSKTEGGFRHLERLGVFDAISGLVVSKPESYDSEGAPFGRDELIREVVGPRSYPIVSDFDCGHTQPMITLAQLARVTLEAARGFETRMIVEEPMVS